MNFIFDVGNVLVTYKPLQFLERMYPDKKLAERLYKAVFLSNEWQLMDQGMCSHAEATYVFCEREPDIASDIRKIMENVFDFFLPIPEVIELLPALKARGHRLYYLSNIHHEIRDYLLEKNGLFELFDGGVFSCDIRIVKPSFGIYHRLLDENHLIAEECIFFDDIMINVEAASSLGIKGVLFTGIESAKPYFEM